MIPYILTFLISLFFFYHADKRKGGKKILFLILGILPLVVLAGLRDLTIGTDTGGYPTGVFMYVIPLISLDRAVNELDIVEPSFVTIAYYVSRISRDVHTFFFVNQLIIISGVVWACKRFRVNTCLAMCLYMLAMYNASLNAMRQSMAVPYCTLSLIFLIDKKYIPSILFLVLGYCFHHSAILYAGILILYWTIDRYKRLRGRKIFILILIGVTIIYFGYSYILNIMVQIGMESKYVERYGSSDEYGSNVPISSIAFNAFNLIYFWYITRGRKIKTEFWYFSTMLLLLSLSLCSLAQISTYAIRITEYFYLMDTLILTYYTMLNRYKNVWMLISFYIFYWVMSYCVANLGDTMPYSSRIIETWF